jgi:hypothetical protein
MRVELATLKLEFAKPYCGNLPHLTRGGNPCHKKVNGKNPDQMCWSDQTIPGSVGICGDCGRVCSAGFNGTSSCTQTVSDKTVVQPDPTGVFSTPPGGCSGGTSSAYFRDTVGGFFKGMCVNGQGKFTSGGTYSNGIYPNNALYNAASRPVDTSYKHPNWGCGGTAGRSCPRPGSQKNRWDNTVSPAGLRTGVVDISSPATSYYLPDGGNLGNSPTYSCAAGGGSSATGLIGDIEVQSPGYCASGVDSAHLFNVKNAVYSSVLATNLKNDEVKHSSRYPVLPACLPACLFVWAVCSSTPVS